MSDLKLVIGDKNLSSWSLRPWLALKQGGIEFEEQKILLDRPESRANLRKVSPSGLVPVLCDGDVMVWESLAICEYVNERFPQAQLWPSDTEARAHARSISAEMHSGFGNLRTVWPMQMARSGLNHLRTGGVQKDIDRIVTLWTEALSSYADTSAGPFLYGAFSIADAMYAPVVSRFDTYGPVEMPPKVAAWTRTILELPAMQEWKAEAILETKG